MMRRPLAGLLGLLLVPAALADGWSSPVGVDRRGRELHFVPAEQDHPMVSGPSPRPGTYNVYVLRRNRDGGIAGQQVFPRQACVYTRDQDFEPVRFACQPSGRSPLAGARYRVWRNPDEKDCSYQYRYECTHGCARAPAVLWQAYWECESS